MGVVQQALADSGESHVVVTGDSPGLELLRSWCGDYVADSGLRLHTATKTCLLLGNVPQADVLPFGDLYASQLAELTGAPPEREALDQALRQFYDERIEWAAAVAHLSPEESADLRDQLEAARFRRARTGLVPKLGGRTIGIDLWT